MSDTTERVADRLATVERILGVSPSIEHVASYGLGLEDELRRQVDDLRSANRDLADLHATIERDLLGQHGPHEVRADLLVQRAILRGELRQAEVRLGDLQEAARRLVRAAKAWVRSSDEMDSPEGLRRHREAVSELANAVDAFDPLLGLEGTA